MSTQVANGLEPWTDLNDKVVMVTGASSGIGKEFCTDLAKAGCKIIAAARRVDRLKSLCDGINHSQSEIKAVPMELDVSSDGASIEAAVKNAWNAFGRIDVLINNAGVRGRKHTPLDLTEEEWNDTIKTNLTGAWLVSKYVCIHMRDAKMQGGSVINISSVTGLERGHVPGGLAYAASKTAMNIMTKVMAMELGKYNIRVNAIAPGLFKSEIREGLMKIDWLKNVTGRVVPMKDFRYLIHDSSKYVSGNIFIVDSGLSLPGFPIFSSL